MPLVSKHIFLIGMPGSGKSVVAPSVAEQLRLPWVDSDELIADSFKLSIPEIFARMGEKAFRHAEAEVIRQLTGGGSPTVIALGGGAVVLAANRELIWTRGRVVWLSCSQKELYRRLRRHTDRPLLVGSPVETKQRLADLLSKRNKWYRQADIRISTTSRSVAVVVASIARQLRQLDDRA